MTVLARRRPTPVAADAGPRLWFREGPRGPEPYTRALGSPPGVRGERIREHEGVTFRHWDPTRSKLAAALLKGWPGALPAEGERWLYLGAASGTTATHVADLVGPTGAVYAVEPSLRPFITLVEVAERYPNLMPILGDARRPEEYGGSVPIVDGLYADVSQPDQPEILSANRAAFLRDGGQLLFVVKTASMGREGSASRMLEAALDRLPRDLSIGAPCSLEPFHKRHYLVGSEAGRRSTRLRPRPGPERERRLTRPAGRGRGRS